MSDQECAPPVPHYDRDRALAEALDVAVGRGAGEVDVSQLTPGVGDGTTGGELVTRIAVPDWAARSWQVSLSWPQQLGLSLSSRQVYTWYSLATQQVPDLRNPALPMIARVVWGQGGASFQADVSWFNGTSFVVHGSYVEIRAVLLTPWGTGIPAPATVKARAAITPADANGRKTSPPMLQSAPATIAPTASAFFLVPPFATSARIVRRSGPNNFPTLEINQFSDLDAVQNIMFEIVGPSNVVTQAARSAERMFPIPGNSRLFQIRNMEATFTHTFHIEWELNLG